LGLIEELSKEQLYWQLSNSDSFVWDIDMDKVDIIQMEDGALAGVLFTKTIFYFLNVSVTLHWVLNCILMKILNISDISFIVLLRPLKSILIFSPF